MSSWSAPWPQTLSREDPALVAFEPMNEPVVDCDEDNTNFWPERLKRLYAAARASATRLTHRALRRLLGRRRGAGEDRPEGHSRRQCHLDVPFLRAVPADPRRARPGPATSSAMSPACPTRRMPCRAPNSTQRSKTVRQRISGRGAVPRRARHARLSRRADRHGGHQGKTRRRARRTVRDRRRRLGEATWHRFPKTSSSASSA